MRLNSSSFSQGECIPERCAFGVPDPNEHMQLGENRNPELSWSELPAGTKSLVLLCIDSEVPSIADDVNQAGKVIPANLPRVDFFHWVMVDIAPAVTGIAEGECSEGVTAHGKDAPPGPAGSRQGINDYTAFLAGNADMEGSYFGYDGPCPPWNDERLHRYHFVLYATDLDACPVDGAFTGGDVCAAIDGHVLAEASIAGTYSLNPDVG